MPPHTNDRQVLLSGDEALARGAWEQGVEFAASYPGTPATEILEYLSGFPEVDAQWSVNEKVAFEVALASSIAGRRSLFSAKHVGFNVAMDPLMTSAYTGVGAGFVVVSCDDPGMHSSQNEQDNRLLARIAKIPLLEPSTPAEAKDFMRHAFLISERFDTPVMARLTTRIAHSKQNMAVGKRTAALRKAFKNDTAKYVMVPRNAFKRHELLERKLGRLQAFSERSVLNRVELKNKKLGFLASGAAYLYAKEMYPDASFLKLGFGYPFPAGIVREFASRVREVVVIEELEPFWEEYLMMLGIKYRAKHPSWRVGELRPEYLPLILQGKERPSGVLPSRKPVMCPGCPHRLVFSVLKKLKLTVTGDIGCYTLGAAPPLSALHTCLCMGSGITFFEGFRRALGKSVVGVIGDSTFVHTGVSGLINLSYNRTKGLVIVLDNGTTAMTGNQPHPATGKTAQNQATRKLVLEDLARSSGADNVDVVDPHRLKEMEALVRARVEEDALSVIIARSPCKLISSQRGRPPVYHKEKCKSCYVCLGIDCPAITKDNEAGIIINESICNGCNLCVEVCAFGALTGHA